MARQGHNLLQHGVVLLLFSLVTGLFVPALAVPRLGVAAHIVGVLGGLFLIVLGLLWPQLRLASGAARLAYVLALYALYAGWLMPLLGGAWGAGSAMLPLAAGGAHGTPFQEGVIATGLMSAAAAILALCGLLFWGLRAPARAE